jgi:hypothetical protein
MLNRLPDVQRTTVGWTMSDELLSYSTAQMVPKSVVPARHPCRGHYVTYGH